MAAASPALERSSAGSEHGLNLALKIIRLNPEVRGKLGNTGRGLD